MGTKIYKLRKKERRRSFDEGSAGLMGGTPPPYITRKKIQKKVQQTKVLTKVIQVVTKPTTKTTANHRVHNPCALANAARGCHAC